MIKNNLHQLVPIVLVGLILTTGWQAKAQSTPHKGITFQGVIKLPNGKYPSRKDLSVNARILSDDNCILREEQFDNVSITNGYINLVIGAGRVVGSDPGLTLVQVMDNSKEISDLTCLQADGEVNPSVNSFAVSGNHGARKFRVGLYIDNIPIVADFNMRAAAYAINSETLDGKGKEGFIQTTAKLTQSRLEDLINAITDMTGGGAVRWNSSQQKFEPYDPDIVPGGSIVNQSITDAQISNTAAIGWSKVDKSGAAARDVGAIANAGGAPSIQAGNDTDKGNAGTTGRLYISSDTKKIYYDTGSTWIIVGSSAASDVTGTVAIANGGTAATNATDARVNLGLGNIATLSTNSDSSQFLRGDGTWGAGPVGATGAMGPQGPKGDKGDKGDTGATGATGAGITGKNIYKCNCMGTTYLVIGNQNGSYCDYNNSSSIGMSYSFSGCTPL